MVSAKSRFSDWACALAPTSSSWHPHHCVDLGADNFYRTVTKQILISCSFKEISDAFRKPCAPPLPLNHPTGLPSLYPCGQSRSSWIPVAERHQHRVRITVRLQREPRSAKLLRAYRRDKGRLRLHSGGRIIWHHSCQSSS